MGNACTCNLNDREKSELEHNMPIPIEDQIKAASYCRHITEDYNNNITQDLLEIKSQNSCIFVDLSKIHINID